MSINGAIIRSGGAGPLVVLYSEMVQVCRSADSGML